MAVIYLCPADKRLLCSWEGYATEIKQHFENEHNGLLFRTNSVEIELHKLPQNKLLCLEEELYLMQNYIENEKLLIKLRYLGTSEAASRLQYNLCITVNQIVYKYDPSRFSLITPTLQSWEVNLTALEKFHNKFESLQCTVLLDNFKIRKFSDISLKINNHFVERNFCDETLDNMFDNLSFLDKKLDKLKQEKKRESGDIIDNISQLNFSILEESFTSRFEDKSENIAEVLFDIPEEINLTCSSCHLDMLPPIFLCTNRHNVCSKCKTKPCQICNEPITMDRNTELEKISRKHLHQCKYSSEGCNEKLFYNELRAHEIKCVFSKYKCVLNDCPYEGKFDHFVNHLKVVHSSVKIGYSNRNDFPKNYELFVANKSIGIFYCKSEVQRDFLIWKATFCGPSERQFSCELIFKGSKYKKPVFLKRIGNIWETRKTTQELKTNKAKEKYAVLTITSYDT